MNRLIKSLIFLGLLLPLRSQAVGISVTPPSLDIIFPDTKESHLVITNISQEPVVVSIRPDHFADYIKVIPSEISLLPEEVSKVKIESHFEEFTAGVNNTYISVITKPLDKKSFNAASGLKIPITVHIVQSYWQWSGAIIFIVVFFSLFILALVIQSIFILFKFKKRKRGWLGTNFLIHHKKSSWWRR